jgi:hypothetical protein
MCSYIVHRKLRKPINLKLKEQKHFSINGIMIFVWRDEILECWKRAKMAESILITIDVDEVMSECKLMGRQMV